MEVVYPRCCGVDVHKKFVTACRIIREDGGAVIREVKTFSTMTQSLLEFSDWLCEGEITHVAMESTGDYWKPVYNILEDRFEVLVVNARHIKAVPGRKTDVKDSEWIADLLQHGLLRASFIPPPPQRILRDLTRHRNNFIRERTNLTNRIQRVLEDANIKLSNVATSVLGVSGRSILDALVRGESNAEEMAALCRGRLREKQEQMERALTGLVKPHHRLILAELLTQVDSLNRSIDRIDTAIEEACRAQAQDHDQGSETGADSRVITEDGEIVEPEAALSYAEAVALLDTIPGIARMGAQIIVAEIGTNMDRFPTPGHMAAWAGVAPANNQSGGRRLSGASRPGNRTLKKLLVQVAHSAAHVRGTYLSDQYHRLAARRGSQRAALGVAHSVLVIAWHMLKRKQPYRELGADYLDKKHSERTAKTCVNRLQRLGYEVTLTPANAAGAA